MSLGVGVGEEEGVGTAVVLDEELEEFVNVNVCRSAKREGEETTVDEGTTVTKNAQHINRLTAAKEAGETIVIDGKPVALGIPGGRSSDSSKPAPGIPLGRGATPDEAAASVLL